MTDLIRYDDSFNLDALSKAYETGILRKEDFANDEHWSLAMDIFAEQTQEEPEIKGFDDKKHVKDWLDLCTGIEQEFGIQEASDLSPDVFGSYTDQLFLNKGYTHSPDLFTDEDTQAFIDIYGAARTDDDNEDWSLDELID
jgi:hypothetical protein